MAAFIDSLRYLSLKSSVGTSLASAGVPLRHRLRALLAERSSFLFVCCSAFTVLVSARFVGCFVTFQPLTANFVFLPTRF